ncbi:hypothetical protein F2Q70_00026877 [Brassica cretica]|uniref:Protein kinase domain-containing protein n=1 Tax=Brassica cretica TaxID=69181 RepID=A0A8S9LBN9_BRACR|nr:hypothetical protein F2Q70_00026877 [Brassica cretica]
MAQLAAGMSGRVIGDYAVGRQIGSGSFSVVWEGRHLVDGTVVAIKEIAMARLSKKLQDSLMSEIFILRKINHPNIIRFIDMIEAPGKINLVLEYCKGGDLSMFIQRHGKIPDATAKHFMQQLAAGLQVLRDNNIIHRDLKPQNLLLSTDDNDAALKIADFGFARSLQPRGLAETLCGSPLYMAPEIMQLQKYDAKADLWSVGAILFQLVTGRTPFTGNSQVQLFQNIMRSTELQFPVDCRDLTTDCKDLCQKLLRRNPVERLTFEEFFHHPFLSDRQSYDVPRSRSGSRTMDGFHSSGSSPSGKMEEVSHDDSLPFFLDDDSSEPEGSPSYIKHTSPMKSSYGFSVERREAAASSPLKNMELNSRYSRVSHRADTNNFKFESHRLIDRNQFKPSSLPDSRSLSTQGRVGDTPDSIDQDYVLISGPSVDIPSSSSGSPKLFNYPFKSHSPPVEFIKRNVTSSTAPMPIAGATGRNIGGRFESLESPNSLPASGVEGSLRQDSNRVRRNISQEGSEKILSQIQREFVQEVERAEDLAKFVESGNTKMPDAMEIIFQAALTLGIRGGVDEVVMGEAENAVTLYTKAVRLLVFLVVEAQTLILNPPLTLTNSVRGLVPFSLLSR